MCPGWGRRSDASSAAVPGSLPAALRGQNSRYCFPCKATVSESDATCWLYCVETAWKEQTEAEGDKPQPLGPRCSRFTDEVRLRGGGGGSRGSPTPNRPPNTVGVSRGGPPPSLTRGTTPTPRKGGVCPSTTI